MRSGFEANKQNEEHLSQLNKKLRGAESDNERMRREMAVKEGWLTKQGKIKYQINKQINNNNKITFNYNIE